LLCFALCCVVLCRVILSCVVRSKWGRFGVGLGGVWRGGKVSEGESESGGGMPQVAVPSKPRRRGDTPDEASRCRPSGEGRAPEPDRIVGISWVPYCLPRTRAGFGRGLSPPGWDGVCIPGRGVSGAMHLVDSEARDALSGGRPLDRARRGAPAALGG
jgi:hypothetical protein